MLHTFNQYSVIHQLYFSKTEKKNPLFLGLKKSLKHPNLHFLGYGNVSDLLKLPPDREIRKEAKNNKSSKLIGGQAEAGKRLRVPGTGEEGKRQSEWFWDQYERASLHITLTSCQLPFL